MTSRAFLRFAAALLFGAMLLPASAAPNLVLISIDTLRADHLPMYGYSKNTAPFLATLAEDGIVFEHAVTPLPNTTPSHASMLTGVYPPRHGSVGLAIPMRRGIDTLASALSRRGYYTAASVAVGHVGRRFNFDQGFAEFTQPPDDVAKRDGAAVNADAIAALKRYRSRPRQSGLFLFVHYFDCHAPYGWWRGEERDSAKLPVEQRIAQYDESIRHVDELVRNLYEEFRRAGMLEDTVFCITSDHGEQLGERGLASGHADIYQETVKVPLIVAGPGIPSTRIRQLVSPMDIAPSLAALAGTRLLHATDGVNILPDGSVIGKLSFALRGPEAARNRSILTVGNPWYARGIGLHSGDDYFIRNFDYLYREARVQKNPPAAERVMKPLTAASASDGVRFPLPVTSYLPFVVTVDLKSFSAKCTGEVGVQLDPGFAYFTTTVDRTQPVRLQFSAGRLDYLTVVAKGAGCTAMASYRLERAADARPVPGNPVQTYLYDIIYSPRKSAQGDELYDTAGDAAMTRNRIGSAPRARVDALERELRSLYEKSYGRSIGSGATTRVPKEEIEKLKSLGYLF